MILQGREVKTDFIWGKQVGDGARKEGWGILFCSQGQKLVPFEFPAAIAGPPLRRRVQRYRPEIVMLLCLESWIPLVAWCKVSVSPPLTDTLGANWM